MKRISSFSTEIPKEYRNVIAILLIIITFILFTAIIYLYTPVDVAYSTDGPISFGFDWKYVFREASLRILSGKNPYSLNGLFSPPWILFPLIPIALLSPPLGSAVIFVLNLFAYIYVFIKLEINYWFIPPLVIFSDILGNSANGNIEGLISLGFILPPQIGLFFLLAKPQIGIAVSLFWIIEAWRDNGLKEVVKISYPVIIGITLSVVIFGTWFLKSQKVISRPYNSSIWPLGLPIGFGLLILAIWKRDKKFAIIASPFFAPYLTDHSWAIVWIGISAVVSDYFIPSK